MSQVEKVVIIIPTYNECDVIRETVCRLQEAVSAVSDFDVHLLVFDSNSPDGTAMIVRELQMQYKNLHLAMEPQKTGLGGAYIKAMQYAISTIQADVVIEYDADGSHQPCFVPKMLTMLKEGADVVVGSRYVCGGSIPADWGFHRKFLSIVGNWVARFFLTTRYKDFTSGLRATRTTVLKKVLLEKLLSKGYAYKIHLLWALHKAGAHIVEIPIQFIDRKKGYSKLPRNNIYDSLRVVFLLRLKEMEQYIKVCVVGLIGMFIQLLLFNFFRFKFVPVLANAIAIECAIISNFMLNNYFSFKKSHFFFQQKANFLKKLLKFNGYSLLSLTLQTLVVYATTQYFKTNILLENLFVIIGIIIGSVVNYFIYSKLIWPKSGISREFNINL